MNRKYTRQIFIDTVERMVQRAPDFTVTTDVIVGFPGETEIDFNETLEMVERVQFAKVHMFPFSPRKRTRAALYPNKVPQEMIRSRKQELLRLAEKTAFDLRQRFVGRRMEVLLENETKPGFLSGHTANFLRVWLPAGTCQANDLVEVELIGNEPDGLVGRL
jgi:threonylcarbamoyladenosine tRNA methylthiotransferase MtaB